MVNMLGQLTRYIYPVLFDNFRPFILDDHGSLRNTYEDSMG